MSLCSTCRVTCVAGGSLVGSSGPWQHAADREFRQVRPRSGCQVDRPQDVGGSWRAPDSGRLRPVLPRRPAHCLPDPANPRRGGAVREEPLWWTSYAEPACASAWRPAVARVRTPRRKPLGSSPRSFTAPGCRLRQIHLGDFLSPSGKHYSTSSVAAMVRPAPGAH